MNDEVTDINEILKVINTIQVKLHTIQQNMDSHPLSFRLIRTFQSLKVRTKDSCNFPLWIVNVLENKPP